MAVKKPKKNDVKKKPPKDQKQSQLTLDDVIIALQKSFSRVSARSAEVSPDDARAMVAGQVGFDMSLKVNLEKDYLHPSTQGAIDLRLSGNIDTDIRAIEEEEADT